MNFGLGKDDIQKIKSEIFNHIGSTSNPKIYIYGSRVKGNHREFSDIDLLLEADSYDEEALSQIDFTELDIPYKVDFVLSKDLFEGYRSEINSHRVEL